MSTMATGKSKGLNGTLETARSRLQAQLSSSMEVIEKESKKVLNQMGADLDNEDKSIAAVVARLREHNGNLKQFSNNLDKATYDVRGRINWNLHMMSAYARLQADKAVEQDLKPMIREYRESLESSIRKLSQKANELKARLIKS